MLVYVGLLWSVTPTTNLHHHQTLSTMKTRHQQSTTNYCARCYALAERDGQMGWYHDDGRDNDWQTNTQATGHLEGMCRVVCGYGCKVYQCRDCIEIAFGWRMATVTHCQTHGWDHRAQTDRHVA